MYMKRGALVSSLLIINVLTVCALQSYIDLLLFYAVMQLRSSKIKDPLSERKLLGRGVTARIVLP